MPLISGSPPPHPFPGGKIKKKVAIQFNAFAPYSAKIFSLSFSSNPDSIQYYLSDLPCFGIICFYYQNKRKYLRNFSYPRNFINV